MGRDGAKDGPSVGEIDHQVEVEITDVLDLHSFLPRDIAEVLRSYLDVVFEQGLSRVRIIHGRGIGVQRRTVQTILERDPRVLTYGDAPPDAGGWGATWAEIDND